MVTSQTILALPTKSVTLSEGWLAMHGVYIAWASSDLGSFTPASAPARSTGIVLTIKRQSSLLTTEKTASKAQATQSSTLTMLSSKIEGSETRTTSSRPRATATVFVTHTSNSSSKDHLSVPAQAGIGVGVGVAAISAIVLGLWALTRRRRRKAWGKNGQTSSNDQLPEEKANSPELSVAQKRHASELSSDGALSELHGFSSLSEIQSRQVTAELEGR